MATSVLSLATSSFLRLEVRTTPAEMSGYNRVEVWKSILGESGPYFALSADTWRGAVLPPDITAESALTGPLVNIAGKKLDLLVNSKWPISVTFTGPNPRTYLQCATQITAASPALIKAFVDTNGALGIRTVPAGGNVKLEIVGGDAAPLLGLPVAPNNVAFGYDPHVPMFAGVFSYVFQDYYWENTAYYRTRFSNSLTGIHSEFSTPFSASDKLGIDPANIVLGYVNLLRPDGRPSERQEVTVFNSYNAQILGDFSVVGGPKVLYTDDMGYAEFPLIRGITVDLGIGGTNMIRRVNVPADPAVIRFNMLDPDYGVDDNFTVQQASLPYAQRGSL
jgi:hypothetical protein